MVHLSNISTAKFYCPPFPSTSSTKVYDGNIFKMSGLFQTRSFWLMFNLAAASYDSGSGGFSFVGRIFGSLILKSIHTGLLNDRNVKVFVLGCAEWRAGYKSRRE